MIFLPLPHCWNSRHVPPGLAIQKSSTNAAQADFELRIPLTLALEALCSFFHLLDAWCVSVGHVNLPEILKWNPWFTSSEMQRKVNFRRGWASIIWSSRSSFMTVSCLCSAMCLIHSSHVCLTVRESLRSHSVFFVYIRWPKMSSSYSFGVLGKPFLLFPGPNSEPAWLILEEINFF